jgi:branched-chain amino acid transport system permease protein
MDKRKLVKPLGFGALFVVLLLLPQFIRQPYVCHIFIMMGVNIILAVSLRFIAMSGQFSLGHAGMVSIGAYTSALLVIKGGLSFWLALPLSGLTAMSIACLVGYPFTRLKGIYFTMVTLFLAEFIRLTAEQWKSLTGGVSGIMTIPRPNPIIIPGLLNADFASKTDFYYLILMMVGITLLIFYAIESSRVGMTFLSIQQSESLSESIGINSTRFRVLAFGIGCFFAGIDGSFYSHYFSAIAPGSFGFLLGIYIFIYMVVGGMKRFAGPMIGAVILTLIPEFARRVKAYEPFVFAAILLLTIFFLRGGIISLPERLSKIITRRVSLRLKSGS